ncbi:MAG: penicillin-binding protein 2 [Planctomycetaceae bacterium]
MPSARLQCLVMAFAIAAVLIAARLVQLQIVDGGELAARAVRQGMYVETIPARPGDVVDRHGRLLAVTVLAPSLYVVPNRIDEPDAIADRLADVLGLDAGRLANALRREREKSFLWIRRRMTEEQATAVRALSLPRDAWGFRDEYLRRYPQGAFAAHLIGLRDIDNVGHGGVEERFDEALRGQAGRRVIRRDARGRAIDVREEVTTPPTPGRTLVLTIDSVVQLFAEQALDELMARHAPNGSCAIVMNVKSSEVLAMASRPAFDPNDPDAAAGDVWSNRAVTAVYEPGSTFKPLVVAWAIDAGMLQTDEVIDCEGGMYRSGGRVLHDHHGYGELSVTDVLVKSSNIGMAKIGERLETAGLHGCVTAFGFGRPTGIELPGERAGVVRPLDRWNAYSIGSVPMGHEIAVTPLQLATAHAALANGGRLLSPRVVLRDVDPVLADSAATAAAATPQVTSRVVGEPAADWVITEPMVEVVRRGTGRAAALDGYTVFGKTGTAQKFDQEAGAFSHDRHVVSFIAGAPADDPRVIVLVMADEPTGSEQSGGAVAAPAVASILRRTLRHFGVPGSSPDELAKRDL